MTNYCFTLGFNLVTEIEKSTRLLYDLNDRDTFKHLIVDLGFPLEQPDQIPDDIELAKERNSEALKEMAERYGSDYVKMPNIGVSQNWTQVYKYLKPKNDDILIGTDPDEHPQQGGWVRAMGDVMRAGSYGLCSLMMPEHISLIPQMPVARRHVAGIIVYVVPDGRLNWALIGLSGKLLDAMGGVPYPQTAPVYGWIEAETYPRMREAGIGWCILADFFVKHTDYDQGSHGSSPLLRGWKNDIIFGRYKHGQITFEEWLIKQRDDNNNGGSRLYRQQYSQSAD